MPITRRTLVTAASLAALCLAAPQAFAQTQAYPNKPVTIVVPFAAGGGVDNITRLVNTEFGKRLGQTAVIDNRGGASGNIGSGLVARAKPDGYTLLMGATFLALNKATMPNLHYDAVKDLIPVARVGQAPAVLVVSPSLPVDSVQELVAYMRDNEKTVSYGSVGYASPPHLLFTRHAGIRPTEILYKGGAAAMPDLMSGRLTFMIQTTSEVLPYIKGGKLKALAVTSPERFHALPDVPTMQEAGVTDLAWTGFWGLFAPAGTSPDIVQQLSNDMMAVVALPEVAESIAQLGIEAAPLPAAAFQEFFMQSVKEHEEVAKAFNIRIE